jgi:hypothetical protein
MDNRSVNRWYLDREEKAVVSCSGEREEATIIDIGAGGMKVSLCRSLGVGAIVYGEFKILPQLGPFFVRGKVVRVDQKSGLWETSVSFDKVSSIPLQ